VEQFFYDASKLVERSFDLASLIIKRLHTFVVESLLIILAVIGAIMAVQGHHPPSTPDGLNQKSEETVEQSDFQLLAVPYHPTGKKLLKHSHPRNSPRH